jgi:hypothetical protein
MFEIALASLPLLVLLASLLLGRYPGCETIVRLAERISARSPLGPGAPRRARRPHPPLAAQTI